MMKVNSREIKNAVEFFAKRVETEVSTVSKHSENSKCLTNPLEAMAMSARAGVDSKRTDILKRYSSVISKIESGQGVKEFVVNGENIARDVELLRKPGRLIDNYVPIFRSEKEALESVRTGDVFQIQRRETVSIKNKSGEVEQLSMDRQSYFDMFPPVERFMNVQPEKFGICYEITSLNAVMENPETRENLLRCIDTVSNKEKIRVKFPNGASDGFVFDPKDIENEGLQYYSKGCDGIKYIEHALGKEYEQPFIKYTIDVLRKKGQHDLATRIEKLSKRGQYGEIAKLCGADNKASLSTNLREAGDAVVPWRILGFEENATIESGDFLSKVKDGKRLIDDRRWLEDFKSGASEISEDKFLELLISKDFFDAHLVEAYVGNEASSSNLYKWHSYRLAPAFDKQGNIESYALKNPHGVTDEVISANDILDMIDSISFAKIK